MTDLCRCFKTQIWFCCFGALTALMLSAPPAHGEFRVDLELVLAVDVSNSMDKDERLLQRAGFAKAFRDPSIHRAIRTGLLGRIAVTYVEWAGTSRQRVAVPWTLIDSPEASNGFADLLEKSAITRSTLTSISSALAFSGELLAHNSFTGFRRVIDISGDGPNNHGGPVLAAREEILRRGIIINGLPIQMRKASDDLFDVADLDIYYEDCVIGGPGSFIVAVKSRDELVQSIRKKLLYEIAGKEPTFMRAAWQLPKQQRISCMVGEELWGR